MRKSLNQTSSWLLPFLLASASLPNIAHAQTTAASDNTPKPAAETVIVTGERNRAAATTVAQELAVYGTDVQVISGATVEQSGAINFAEAVQFLVKGVNVGYSPDEGEYTIRLDGGGDRDTLLTLDGTPLYDRGPVLENIWGATTIDNHIIENIEVFRGGNSLYFGSNGGVGVVNVISKKPNGTVKGDFGISYGAFNTRELWGNYSFPLDSEGRHSVMFYGSLLATDGPRIYDPKLFTDNVALSGGIQEYPLNKNNIGAKYLFKIDDNTEFRLNAIYTESWFQDAFPSGESYSPNTLRFPIIDSTFTTKFGDNLLIEASAYYSNPLLWNAELYPVVCRIAAGCPTANQVNAAGVTTRTVPRGAWTGFVEPAFAHGFGTTNQYKSGFVEMGATARATYKFNEFLEVVGGVQYVTYKDDSDARFAVPNNDTTTTGVFVDLHPTLPFSPKTGISLAIRTDFSDAFDSKTIWKFGFKHPFLTDFYVRANGGTSYSLPQTNELYINNPRPPTAVNDTGFTTIGNSSLLPEETETYNGAFGYTHEFGDNRLFVEVGGFKTEITNRISTTSGRPLIVTNPSNGAATPVDTFFNNNFVNEILGWSAEVDLKLGEQWSFNLGYTNQDSALTGGSRKGLQLNETPSWFATASINWTSEDKRLKVQFLPRIQGSEWSTGGPAIAGTTKPAGPNGRGADTGVPRYRYNFGDYTVVNATITYMAGEDMQHRFQLRVANLFDEYYAERWGFGNNFYGAAFNRGEYTNTDDRYFYGYPFEGKPRSIYATYATKF
jgi:outer membrane receptor for ferrienterochelin and colicin